MKPSLDNAYARVRRAEYHLSKLESERPGILSSVLGWAEGQEDLLISDLSVDDGITSLPPTFSIRVGEAIYNLRAALDYLVYELAILDSGNVQQGTQFPIEDTKDGWRLNGPKYLRGLCTKHQAAIERLQPYKGCNWTKRLRALSNPDKHRTLTVVRRGPLITNANFSSSIVTPMVMYRKFSFHIIFDDGSEVIETLQVLKNEVSRVLDQFNPDF